MAKVKIVLLHERYYSDDDYSSTQRILGESLSDWEEITDDELKYLREHLYKLNFGITRYPTIVVQDDIPVRDRITSIKELVKKERAKAEAERRKNEKEKAERSAKKAAKTREKELKLFKEFQEKYGNTPV